MNSHIKKWPKSALTLGQRQEIITLKIEGYSNRQVARKNGIPNTTVDYSVKRHAESGKNNRIKELEDPK
jgi:IS30 family transposase